jgi:hypothetical protein
MEIQRLSAESRYSLRVWRRLAIRRRLFMPLEKPVRFAAGPLEGWI